MGLRTRRIAEILGLANHSTRKISSDNVAVSVTAAEGNEGFVLPKGTDAQRLSTEGAIRYNTTSKAVEFRDDSGYTFLGKNETPEWFTVSGTLGTLNDGQDATNLTTQQVSATDAESDSLTYSLKAGSSLPAGLSIATNGTISGTPDTVATQTTTNFILKVTDGTSVAERQYAITVNAPSISFTTASGTIGTVDDGDRGSPSLSAVTATGSSGSLTYSVVTGSEPSGLTLGANGSFTGTLDAVNTQTTSTFTVRATLTNGDITVTEDREFSVTVNPPTFSFTTASGSIGTIFDSTRSSYSLSSVTGTASSGTVAYSITVGSEPAGLTMASDGSFSGTATAVGTDTTSTFTVTATLTSGAATVTDTREFSIVVKAPVQQVFSNTGSSQSFDTSSVKSFAVYAWGGGSQSGNQTAQGGFVQADVTVGAGIDTVYIVVGRHGGAGNNTSIWNGGGGTDGAGGSSYDGGGLSGMFTGSSPSQGNAVVIAGGAGGDGSNNNIGPLNGGNHSSSPDNCCGTGGGTSGSALLGGNGGSGSNAGGGGGGGYVGGGGGGGACCSGNGGKGGQNYTSGNGDATTSSTNSVAGANTGHPISNGSYGLPGNNGALVIVY